MSACDQEVGLGGFLVPDGDCVLGEGGKMLKVIEDQKEGAKGGERGSELGDGRVGKERDFQGGREGRADAGCVLGLSQVAKEDGGSLSEGVLQGEPGFSNARRAPERDEPGVRGVLQKLGELCFSTNKRGAGVW